MRKTILISALILILSMVFVSAETYTVIGSRELTKSTDGKYAFMNQNQFFEIYYGKDPSSGNVVKIVKDGVEMSLLPMALNWNNDLSQLQQISMPQSVFPSVDGSDIFFNNAYGSGIHLMYETQGDKVKEKIIIEDFTDLVAPAQYVIEGGGVVLEVGFQLGTNAQHIEIDGVGWDKGSEVTTTNDVVVKNDEGDVLYTLPRPYAIDDKGIVSYGSYQFKSSANKLYVRMYFDYSFLKTATYPVVLDPTFVVDYSPTPATHLKEGEVDTEPDSSFVYQIDITSGISDNSSSTKYEVYRTTFNSTSFTFYEVSSNETEHVVAIDGNRIEVNHDYTANKYSKIVPDTPFQNGDQITFWVKPKDDDDDDLWIILTNLTNDVVYGKFQLGDDKDMYEYRYVTLENIPTSISEIYMYNNESQVSKAEADYEYVEIDSIHTDKGQAITGRFSETYDMNYDWYISLYKETIGIEEVFIYAYNNSDVLNSEYVTKTLTGTGWYYTNVNSLMSYMDNLSLTYTQFRIFTDNPIEFSELRLRKEANDTEAPTIVDCDVASTHLGCLDTMIATCNVTDNLAVDNVTFTTNGVVYELIQDKDIWEYYFAPDYDGYEVYDWTNVTAQDISGNVADIDPNITVTYNCSFAEYINIQHSGIEDVDQLNITNTSIKIIWNTTNPSDSLVEYGLTPHNLSVHEHSLPNVTFHSLDIIGLIPNTTYYYNITSSVNPIQELGIFNFTTDTGCIENWVEDSYTCLVNDTYLSTYTDVNACGTTIFLPAQNGTIQSCNYCSENLQQILGICYPNGTQSISWADNNYYSCCYITGLSTDCNILTYPYNETTTQSCQYYNNDLGNITCQNEPNFNVREKEYCLAYIPNQYLNETFKCISYVTELSSLEILQTNPEYRERTTSFLNFGKDPETREYFEPANALVNFYYTDKNLNPENDYTLTIECSSQYRTLKSQMNFQMAYEDYEFVFFRTKWMMANAPYIIGGILMIFIIIGILWLIMKQAV